MTIKTSQLTGASEMRPQSTSAHPGGRRDFVVNMHPSDLESISNAAYLMGTTIEDYLLIAAVQHARRVRIDLGMPREFVSGIVEETQDDHDGNGGTTPQQRYRERLFSSGLALRTS